MKTESETPPDTSVTEIPTSASVPRIEAPAPTTRLLRRPHKLLRTRARTAKGIFRFGTDQSDVTFLCQFDRKRYRDCGLRFVRWFRRGRHVVRVKARNTAGKTDASPAIYRFRVKRVPRRRIARGRGTAHRRHTRHHHRA